MSQIAKPRPLRPLDQLIQEARRREASREEVVEFSRDVQSCSLKASWLQGSERRFIRGAVERRVQEEVQQQEAGIGARRLR